MRDIGPRDNVQIMLSGNKTWMSISHVGPIVWKFLDISEKHGVICELLSLGLDRTQPVYRPPTEERGRISVPQCFWAASDRAGLEDETPSSSAAARFEPMMKMS
ncbi:hypothetical protein RRG08_032434 [Elysia crispata]|uniref:Uncharacterized protein n=1 Tax=Elysia crispata TaxID=231223 RepID=A0AAE0XNZ4_9GAST|nr:hypothetical protein RRG08_032434 [Elysia crispata]